MEIYIFLKKLYQLMSLKKKFNLYKDETNFDLGL